MTVSKAEWSARRLVSGSRGFLLLTLAVLSGLAARVVVERSSPMFASDTFQSLSIASSLVEGRGFTSGGAEHPDASRAVLFPLSIATIHAIVRNPELAAWLVVSLAGAFAVVPMFYFSRSAFGPGAALAALPLGAVSCLVGASSRLLSTSLYVLLVSAMLAALWAAGVRRGWRRWAVAGGLAGLASLARPEGLAFVPVLVTWGALISWWRVGSGRRLPTRAVVSVGAALAAFVIVYSPYAIWVSMKLGRFAPAPGIEYVRAERRVSDHLGLREMSSGVSWTSRARFLMRSDRRALYLETYFLTGTFPDPDPEMIPGTSESTAAGRAGNPAPMATIIRRRWNIVRGNLLRLPRKAYWAHFLPPAVVTLAVAGLATLVARRRRQAVMLLGLAGIASLAPFVNHIEDRFFCVPFLITSLVAASGWAWSDRLVRRLAVSAGWKRALTGLGHAAVLTIVAWEGLHHEGHRSEAVARAALLRSRAGATGMQVAPGAILAINPHFPYWAGRRYRPIPFGTQDGILEYARNEGAVALVLEGNRDLDERPDLTWLTRSELPPQLRLLEAVPHPEGGEFRVFALDSAPPAP